MSSSRVAFDKVIAVSLLLDLSEQIVASVEGVVHVLSLFLHPVADVIKLLKEVHSRVHTLVEGVDEELH